MGDTTRRLTARQIAALVRAGDLLPAEAVGDTLARIDGADGALGAFEVVRHERALREAEELARDPRLRSLPLAGVPVAVKDNVDVEGDPTRNGSRATSGAPAARDDQIVARLRDAGAVVVGKTRCPELCLWGTGDNAFGTARNPWDRQLVPGGSSSGSAAAVSSGMVPLALGSDGLGSIRIPAAACGLVGIKPGPGVVPPATHWYGMTEFGPLATTVQDAALALDVMADQTRYRDIAPQQRPLRISVSLRPPLPVLLDREVAAAVRRAGDVLAAAGHQVWRSDPSYPAALLPPVYTRWTAGAAQDAEGLDHTLLEPRTVRHVAVGRVMRRAFPLRDEAAERWARRYTAWFGGRDLLLLPVLARPPLRADAWRERSWRANFLANNAYAPYAALWNFVRFPAMTVPVGRTAAGLPIGVQLVAPRGREALLLAVAAQLEQLLPWPRQAPGA